MNRGETTCESGGSCPGLLAAWWFFPSVRRLLLLGFVSLPGSVNNISMNRIRVRNGHLVVRKGELRRIGKARHAFVPVAAAQDNLIPIFVRIGRHVAKVGNRSLEHPCA